MMKFYILEIKLFSGVSDLYTETNKSIFIYLYISALIKTVFLLLVKLNRNFFSDTKILATTLYGLCISIVCRNEFYSNSTMHIYILFVYPDAFKHIRKRALQVLQNETCA